MIPSWKSSVASTAAADISAIAAIAVGSPWSGASLASAIVCTRPSGALRDLPGELDVHQVRAHAGPGAPPRQEA